MKNDSFDALKKYEQIQKLIELTEPQEKQITSNYMQSPQKLKNDNIKKFQELDVLKLSEKDITIYNTKNKINSNTDFIKEKEYFDKRVSKGRKTKKKKIYKKDRNKVAQFYLNTNLVESKNNLKSCATNNSEQHKSEKLDNSYNIFGIIISSFLCCFMTKKSRLKKELNLKANNTIYNKLDVVLYVRNMLLFEAMNRTLFDDNKKYIFKFLSQPKISNKYQALESDAFYENYNENDFNKFSEAIFDLTQKIETTKEEKELISLSNKELKNLI